MKKHISLNISGIIFHVEEDAFEMLKSYLNDISKHFSSFSGSEEVMSDIERRIAEFFLDRLSVEKEYLTKADVQDLKYAMGPVTSQWEEEARSEHAEASFKDLTYQGNTDSHSGKRLYRDEQRRLIGGVASGIAHYFNLDPLWIRLAFLLVLFDFGGVASLTNIAVLAYIAMWIATPGSFDLEEDDKLQRLFRNPENKVLGGVASGIASYFNIDPTVVRVAFAVSTLIGGIGLLPYIILWVITPEAKTLTERMQMKGEPITLANIEQKIRESLHIEEGQEESTFAKVLLFPFRMISSGIDRMQAGFSTEKAFSNGANILLLIVGGGMVLASTVASMGLLGAVSIYLGFPLPGSAQMQVDQVPLDIVRDTLPLSVVLFTALTAWVPVAYLGIAGMSIASRRIVTKSWVNWGLLLVWLVGIVGSGVSIPMFASDFSTRGVHKSQIEINMPEDHALRIFVSDDMNAIRPLDNVHLTIVGHDGPQAVLVKKLEAAGCSRQSAIEYATEVEYNLEHRDSTLIFSPHYELPEGIPYRNQSLKMELRVPYGKEFSLDEDTRKILRNTIYRNGYTIKDLKLKNRWIFEEEGLRCLTCPQSSEETHFDSRTSTHDGEAVKQITTEPLSSIKIEGIGEVVIRQGSSPSISLSGSKSAVRNARVHISENHLSIHAADKKLQIEIVQPHLESLRFSGPMGINIENYRQENLNISISEATRLQGMLFVENLVLSASEGAAVDFEGACANLVMKGSEGVRINTEEMNVENMVVKGTDGSKIFIGNAANLQTSLDEGSHLYRNND